MKPAWLDKAPSNAHEALDALEALPIEQAMEYSQKLRNHFAVLYGEAQRRRIGNQHE
jgi:hypothetical protein